MTAETLRQKQSRFVRCVGELIDAAGFLGFDLTFGECWRTPKQARWNAQYGFGIANSLHIKRLAIDLNVFKGGLLSESPADYESLGVEWEKLWPDCRWGGRFSKPDIYHFSIEHEGVK